MTTKAPDNSPIRLVLRITLVVVLGIVALAVMRDARARGGAKTAYQLLDTKLDGEESLPSDEEVHQLLSRTPDESFAGDGKTWIEHYRWKGVFREYTLTVQYSVAATKLLTDIQLQ